MIDVLPRPRGLFIMDLDGTLLDHDGGLCDRNHRALKSAAESGIALAIVTGRRRSTFRRERERLAGLAFRSSVSNGAVFLSVDNETVERVHAIDWRGVLDAWAAFPRGVIKSCIAVTLPPAPAPDQLEQPDALILTPEGRFYHAASPWEPERQQVSEAFAISEDMALSRKLVHVAFHVTEPEVAERLVEVARGFCGEDTTIYATRPPRAAGALVDVVPRGGKGLAVSDLAQAFGVPAEAIAAIGDEMNDLPLLQAARFQYAIGGSTLAKRFPGAVEVASSGGVADALERFSAEIG